MSAGGTRPGAGRKKGSVSKFSKLKSLAAKATGEMPHEFLLRVARGETIYREQEVNGEMVKVPEDYDIGLRIDAAKAAAPYFSPKLSAVNLVSSISDEELNAIIAASAAEAGIDLRSDGEEKEE